VTGPADGAIPAAWLAAALDPPRAGGPPPVSGRLRVAPEDFRVEERLGFEPDGGAAHLLLRVEKTDANTLYVARSLARFGDARPADVGFAGLKDRRAIATQWFSVPARPGGPDWLACAQDGFRVLAVHPHSRKLRRGALSGNRFAIVVRGVAGDTAALKGSLARLAANGAPNYFGPQRFGREAANLAGVCRWLEQGSLPRDRDQRGFLLSTARSLAFNAVLGARVARLDWNRLLPGEIVNLAGSGSVFLAEEVDEELGRRCLELDVHPTGPLPGRGGVRPVGEAAEVEDRALEPFKALVDALLAAEVDAMRRPLRVVPGHLEWSIEGDELRVAFELSRGAFATAVLREVLSFDAGALPGDED
jgi:tRNA pseudouridine13 synthase